MSLPDDSQSSLMCNTHEYSNCCWLGWIMGNEMAGLDM